MFHKQSIYLLLDLVEIKLSSIIVQDKEDVREINKLRHSKKELLQMLRSVLDAEQAAAATQDPSNDMPM